MDDIKKLLPKITFAVFIMVAEIASGCSSNSVAGSTNSVPDTWYGHNVQTIFNQHCGGSGGCHINGSANGVNLSSYKAVVNAYSNEYRKKLVDPGNAGSSPLYDKVSPQPRYGYRMPYGRAPLSAAMIDTIKVWINRGAKNK